MQKEDRFYDSEILSPVSDFVAKGIAEYVFNSSDTLQFLFQFSMPCNIIDLDEFKKSEFGFLKNNYVKKRAGKSYGMQGDIVEFKIDKKMCNFFIKKGAILPCLKLKKSCFALENATFLKNGEVIVSECSHEGIMDINPKMKRAFEDEFIKLVKADKQFEAAKKLYTKLNSAQIRNWEREGCILHYLMAYIDEDNEKFMRQATPEYCSYDEFKGIVKTYLSADIYEYFNKFKRFKEIKYSEIPHKYFIEQYYLNLIFDE